MGSGSTDSGSGTETPAAIQAMHRLYNPNSGEYFYTASEAERDHLLSLGWQDEGIAWYGV